MAESQEQAVNEEVISEAVEQTDVPVEELSDEQLEQLLTGETQELEGENSEESAQVDAAQDSPEATPEDEQAADESAEDTEEDSQDDDKSEEELMQVSKAEWDKRARQLAQQEQFLKRRNTELGQLRKEIRELRKEKEEQLEEAYDDNDTRKARKLEKDLEELDKKNKDIDTEEKIGTIKHHYAAAYHKFLQPDELDPVGMSQTAEAIGFPKEMAQRMGHDPIGVGLDPLASVFLAKATRGNKLVMQFANYAKGLQEEVAELKKVAKSAPDKALNGISKALKSKPSIGADSGGAGTVGIESLDPSNIPNLSDEELDRLLSEAGA